MSKKEEFHPVVEAYLRRKPNLIDALRNMPEPRSPIVQAMLCLREALGNEQAAAAALRIAETVPTQVEDKHLHFLFLNFWAMVSLEVNQYSQTKVLIHRAESLISPDTPVEFRMFLLNTKAELASWRGDKEKPLDAYNQSLKLISSDSPHYRMMIWQKAIFLSTLGCGEEMEKDLNWLLERCDEVFKPSRVALPRFYNCVETGRAEEAMVFLAEVEQDSVVTEIESDHIRAKKIILDLMLGRWKPDASRWDDLAHGGKDESSSPSWAHSTYYLLENHPEEALSEARKYMRVQPDYYIRTEFFPGFALIRAELALGNGEAARRLLDKRREVRNVNYLDDFFLARVELLAGNNEVAARHFAAVIEACKRYKAEPRLDFEMSLACELSAGEVMRLTSLAMETPVSLDTKRKPGPPPVAKELRGIERLLGNSPAITGIQNTVTQVAPLDVPVLIIGETGTGKELVARAIHETGPREEEAFLAINCGAIAESLLQSELFGHEKGSFSGAEKAYKGIFEEAGNGTVFLDEIGAISPQLQVVLLRVLETNEIRPVGSATPRRFDCRIIAATNAPLGQLVEENRFRKDLFFRLRRLEIQIPPLRERTDDILSLAYHFLDEGRPEGIQARMLPELEKALLHHPWLGNVRELRNEIERMRLMNSDKLLYEPKDIRLEGQEFPDQMKAPFKDAPDALKESLDAEVITDSASPLPSEKASSFHSEKASKGEIEEFLRQGKSKGRRLERLRSLFRDHQWLARKEIMKLLSISQATATNDLKKLCREGFVEKIMPNASPRSHYFALRKENT